ncbi:MAG: hypothetical protein ACREC3_16305 [Methyloceanibacter sp.]
MNNLSDIIGRNQQPESNGLPDKSPDFLNMRRVQPNEGLVEKLRGSRATYPAGYEHGSGLIIRGLMDLLPKSDSIWLVEDRAKWLRLAAAVFALNYKAGDGEIDEISIVAVTQP